MHSFRKVIFWVHLVAGVISGLSIGIMCFTGTVLAFEKELIAWAERDARRVEVPAAGTPRLPLEELQRRLREAQPEARPMSIIIQNDPQAAIAFSAGRTGSFYVNPYTGEVRQPKSAAIGRFMQTMIEWHRYLGFGGEVSRPRGKLINGICNVAFCALALTGLYLWMPRTWSWRSLRPIVWFRQNTTSKARDFNWHNTIGFWTAPVLIVLTLTAMPISFRWAGNLIYTLTGSTPPAPGVPLNAPANVVVPVPPADARRMELGQLLAVAQKELPNWETITLRLGAGAGRGPRGAAANARATRQSDAGENRPGPQAVTFTVREAGSWPRTATSTLSLDPFTGEVLRREGYADLPAARQVRSWTRFLHTGEALGWGGQLVAGIASLGGVFLMWTGFALTWRRFFGKPAPVAEPATAQADPVRT